MKKLTRFFSNIMLLVRVVQSETNGTLISLMFVSAVQHRFYSDVNGDSTTPQNEVDNSVNVDGSPPRDERVCISVQMSRCSLPLLNTLLIRTWLPNGESISLSDVVQLLPDH